MEEVDEEAFAKAVITKEVDLTKDEITKVDYSGAQVWKIQTNKRSVVAVVGRLRRRNRKYLLPCY